MKVLGEQRAAALRDWIGEQWQRLRSGELLIGPISSLLGVSATSVLAEELSDRPSLTADRIEDASARVIAVSEHYGETAARLEVHAGVLSSAAKWGLFAARLVPNLAPWVSGAALAGYLALLGIGLLLAMDVAAGGNGPRSRRRRARRFVRSFEHDGCRPQRRLGTASGRRAGRGCTRHWRWRTRSPPSEKRLACGRQP